MEIIILIIVYLILVVKHEGNNWTAYIVGANKILLNQNTIK
jgi:hypothetical protein